jgi:NADPH:quinone reductase-like Zn-dependent oxidoreductase
MGIVNSRRQEGGSHAEYVCVGVSSLAKLDPSVDVVGAATIPMNGLTAKMVLDLLNIPRGGSIWVTGGAGATGGYIVELAKLAGLQVVVDAKKADEALLRGLGADYIVPRGEGACEAVKRIFPKGVDGLADAALIGNSVSAAIKDGGSAVILRRTSPINDSRLTVHPVHVFQQDTDNETLGWLAALARDGNLTPRVAMRMPLAQAKEAHQTVERGGLRGRVVLTANQAATSSQAKLQSF